MPRPGIEYEVREAAGLGLGTFDVFLIRQKIYVGEFHRRCEFNDGEGNWRPLAEHPAFQEVLTFVAEGEPPDEAAAVTRRSSITGWKTLRDSSSGVPIRMRQDEPERSKSAVGGITSEIAAVGGRMLGKLFGGRGKD